MKTFLFDQCASSDLLLDATYESDRTRTDFGGDPIARLMGAGNQGGFRFSGPTESPNLVVLFTTLDEADWPDHLDLENGLFVYYGDNRKPGYELHDRSAGRGGNLILRNAFEKAHSGHDGRTHVPPFFIFSRGSKGRDAVFRGLAVPGAVHLDPSSDLVAIWKSVDGKRFQNYRATFTILDVNKIPRTWLDELQQSRRQGDHCPDVWSKWVAGGKAKALIAQRITRVRSALEQDGKNAVQKQIIDAIYKFFSEKPEVFEHFSADLVRMMDPNVTAIDVTRFSRDGGRDAIGKYRIGMPQNCVEVDFALEAKCYAPGSGVGVKALSRLISRLRHRQFGILVTTSHLSDQAYNELVEDDHPVIVCSGGDVAELLVQKLGFKNGADASSWLGANYLK